MIYHGTMKLRTEHPPAEAGSKLRKHGIPGALFYFEKKVSNYI